MKKLLLLKSGKIFLCFLFTWMSLASYAYITTLNSPIDRALYDEHEQKLVVHGVIESKILQNPVSDGSIMIDYFEQYKITFSVKNVILGDSTFAGKRISLLLSYFSWPEELVPFKTDQELIMILKPDKSREDGFFLYTVVPSVQTEFAHVKTNKAAKEILERELVYMLSQETDVKKLDAMLMQVCPILTSSNTEIILPLTKHANQWVKRAALACVIFATEKDEYIKLLAEDIQSFFSTHKENDLIENINGQKGYAPFPCYFNHVPFIDHNSWRFGSRWDEKSADKHLRLLGKLEKTGILSESVIALLNPKK